MSRQCYVLVLVVYPALFLKRLHFESLLFVLRRHGPTPPQTLSKKVFFSFHISGTSSFLGSAMWPGKTNLGKDFFLFFAHICVCRHFFWLNLCFSVRLFSLSVIHSALCSKRGETYVTRVTCNCKKKKKKKNSMGA